MGVDEVRILCYYKQVVAREMTTECGSVGIGRRARLRIL